MAVAGVAEVSRGGYRGGGVMLSRGGSLPSPRGMMRGVASGLPLMGRGSPAKAHPAWGGRNSRQMYGRPNFLRGYELFVFHSVLFFISVYPCKPSSCKMRPVLFPCHFSSKSTKCGLSFCVSLLKPSNHNLDVTLNIHR